MPVVLTIGHSNHPLDRFLDLLEAAGVEMLIDVRTQPYSRRHPHFNQPDLRHTLALTGISYLWLGRELGGRPDDPALFADGIADYERMAERNTFKAAIERVLRESEWLHVALMCAEREPLDCHRCLLVGRALAAAGAEVRHLLAEGGFITQRAIEDQLIASDDLFTSPKDRLATAYRERVRRNAVRS